jgi:hypothetical protein
MPDVTVKSIDEMEAIYGGLARRARAELGVTAWGMQVFTLPPDWDGYPNHNHSSEAFDPNQEEVYIPLSGAATLVAPESRGRVCEPYGAPVAPLVQKSVRPDRFGGFAADRVNEPYGPRPAISELDSPSLTFL